MGSFLEESISFALSMGWPVVILVLGILCLASLRRAVDRTRTIRIKPGGVEIYLDPQGVHEGGCAIEKLEDHGIQENADT